LKIPIKSIYFNINLKSSEAIFSRNAYEI